MATETKLRQLAQGGCPVYYFYSSERYLVRQAVARAAKLLAEGEDEETTVLDGAAPEIEQLIMAAGTISFFGTRRVVLLPEVDPAAYSDKDLDELCATLASLENAVVVLGSVFEMERNKLKLGKRAQKLIAQCTKVGFAEELAKPKPYELKVMVMDRAKAQDTTLSEGTATALLERCGEDPFLLENEVDKLCALSGYQTVTTAMVAEMVRFNARVYPSATPLRYFRRSPYDLTEEAIEQTWQSMQGKPEYADIEELTNNQNERFLFSTQHLTRRYAKAISDVDEWTD